MTQRQRLLVAIAYTLMLVAISQVLFGVPVPSLGSKGVWFFAGIATLLLSTALTEPFFTRPADAVVNAVAAVLVATAFSPFAGEPDGASSETIRLGKAALFLFGCIVAAIGMTAILTKDYPGKLAPLSPVSAKLASDLGSSRVVYSIILLLSVYATYSRTPHVAAALVGSWIVVVVVRPIERILEVRGHVKARHSPAVGRVAAVRYPGLAEVELGPSMSVTPGDLLVSESPNVTGIVLDISAGTDGMWALTSFADSAAPQVGTTLSRPSKGAGPLTAVVGPIEPGTDINEIRFRVPNGIEGIQEGSVVRTKLRGEEVHYQVVRAWIREEMLVSVVAHRFVEVVARKIGVWNEEKRRFRRAAWLPGAGTSVYTQQFEEMAKGTVDAVGVVPGTAFGIRVDVDDLVTHNTAILGILGIGKTCLAFELVRRVLLAGRKVIVIDITGQYADEFRDVFLIEDQEASQARVAGNISATRDRMSVHPQEGGNLAEFTLAMETFLQSDRPIAVFDPQSYEATRQDGKLFNSQAPIVPLTAAETTRVFSEQLLQAMNDRITKAARVCLVLEEAHSLVPEWNSTSYDGDQRASNGTAKAVLQGRKYGLGVVLITQRTANVTKTILNQCNTVFAFRTFDATGMEFLKNYIGDRHAEVLSGLEERTAVLFGRASSCESPVIIRLNEMDEIKSAIWQLPLNCPAVTQAEHLLGGKGPTTDNDGSSSGDTSYFD